MLNLSEEVPVKDNELQYAITLNKKGILPGPSKWNCDQNKLAIQIYNNSCFRCLTSKCRLRYPFRINSFFSPSLYFFSFMFLDN